MRTCKDCLHYKVCQSRITYDENFGDSTSFETKCIDFKNKEEYEKVIHAKWIVHSRQKFTNSDVAAIDENGNPFIKMKPVKVIHYKCSSCNEIFDNNSLYCPDCGAKMDLE